jgi:hypothetical protein
MTSQARDDELGKMAYDAYCTQLGVAGTPDVPPWDGLERRYQEAWISAVRTVEANVRGQTETYG